MQRLYKDEEEDILDELEMYSNITEDEDSDCSEMELREE